MADPPSHSLPGGSSRMINPEVPGFKPENAELQQDDYSTKDNGPEAGATQGPKAAVDSSDTPPALINQYKLIQRNLVELAPKPTVHGKSKKILAPLRAQGLPCSDCDSNFINLEEDRFVPYRSDIRPRLGLDQVHSRLQQAIYVPPQNLADYGDDPTDNDQVTERLQSVIKNYGKSYPKLPSIAFDENASNPSKLVIGGYVGSHDPTVGSSASKSGLKTDAVLDSPLIFNPRYAERMNTTYTPMSGSQNAVSLLHEACQKRDMKLDFYVTLPNKRNHHSGFSCTIEIKLNGRLAIRALEDGSVFTGSGPLPPSESQQAINPRKFKSKKEAKEYVASKVLPVITTGYPEQKFARVDPTSEDSTSGINWVGALNDWFARDPSVSPMYEYAELQNKNEKGYGAAVRCHHNEPKFSTGSTIYPTKKAAKAAVAKIAFAGLHKAWSDNLEASMPKARDTAAKQTTELTSREVPVSPSPKRPELDLQGGKHLVPPTSEPGAVEQVDKLCTALGLTRPDYTLTISVKDDAPSASPAVSPANDLYSGSASFTPGEANGPGASLLRGRVGPVTDIKGKKAAKRACAEKVLVVLQQVESLRYQQYRDLVAGAKPAMDGAEDEDEDDEEDGSVALPTDH